MNILLSFVWRVESDLRSCQNSLADCIRTTGVSVFVNDQPNITSTDSLSIELGDTLFHFFNAQDLNQDSELIYNITTTIDEMIFSGKTGKLVWVPNTEDLGLHTLEIKVSDGFNEGIDTQKLKIFVYKKPTLLNVPPKEAFVNLQYKFTPQAQDMFFNLEPNKDVFVSVSSPNPLFSGSFNTQQNQLNWIPTIQEIGEQEILFLVQDKYNHQQDYLHTVSVLVSPCETANIPCNDIDTLIINKQDTITTTIIDTIYLDKNSKKVQRNDGKWKPKGLGF